MERKQLTLHVRIVDRGELYAQSRRLPFDLPWIIYEVTDDMLLPYFRVHVGGRCIQFTDTLQQAYDTLHNLPSEAISLLKEDNETSRRCDEWKKKVTETY